MNNRLISQAAALLFLAIWHGFHSGYYICFLFEFLVMYMEKDVSIKIINKIKCLHYHISVGGNFKNKPISPEIPTGECYCIFTNTHYTSYLHFRLHGLVLVTVRAPNLPQVLESFRFRELHGTSFVSTMAYTLRTCSENAIG